MTQTTPVALLRAFCAFVFVGMSFVHVSAGPSHTGYASNRSAPPAPLSPDLNTPPVHLIEYHIDRHQALLADSQPNHSPNVAPAQSPAEIASEFGKDGSGDIVDNTFAYPMPLQWFENQADELGEQQLEEDHAPSANVEHNAPDPALPLTQSPADHAESRPHLDTHQLPPSSSQHLSPSSGSTIIFPINPADVFTPESVRAAHLLNIERQNRNLPPLRLQRGMTMRATQGVVMSEDYICTPSLIRFPSLSTVQSENARYGFTGETLDEEFKCRANTTASGAYYPPTQYIQDLFSGQRSYVALDQRAREMSLVAITRTHDSTSTPSYAHYYIFTTGNHPDYRPVIINNERFSVTNRNVNLYVYGTPAPTTIPGTNGISNTQSMMIATNPCFINTAWQPYTATTTIALPAQYDKLHHVYVRHRDYLGLYTYANDAIYLSQNKHSVEEIRSDIVSHPHYPSLSPDVRRDASVYHIDNTRYSHVQFSMQWLYDDTHHNAGTPTGGRQGQRVSDISARGGTAWRMPANGQPATIGDVFWVWDTTFDVTQPNPNDPPLVAYFRLKIDNNTINQPVLRLRVRGGENEYAMTITGTQFPQANTYYHFGLPFRFVPTQAHPFLIFMVERLPQPVVVHVDAVFLFTAPQRITGDSMPLPPSIAQRYRTQGLWMRYLNPVQGYFASSPIYIALTTPLIRPTPTMLVSKPSAQPVIWRVQINPHPQCQSLYVFPMIERPDNALQISINNHTLEVMLNPGGIYTNTITLYASNSGLVSSSYPLARIHILRTPYNLYLPVIRTRPGFMI